MKIPEYGIGKHMIKIFRTKRAGACAYFFLGTRKDGSVRVLQIGLD